MVAAELFFDGRVARKTGNGARRRRVQAIVRGYQLSEKRKLILDPQTPAGARRQRPGDVDSDTKQTERADRVTVDPDSIESLGDHTGVPTEVY